ncbi:hypothetical protein [Streptomyces bauhiniae]
MAYTSQEIREKYPDLADRESILRLHGVSRLMGESILHARYRVPPALHEPLSLTPYGEEACRRLVRNRNFKWPEARLACFLSFYHLDLLIDHKGTNLAELLSAFEAEILSGRVLHPFIWGRELYDKAFVLFSHEPSDLDNRDTLKLLEGSPAGVFQQLDLVTGPLGILRSAEMRSAPPTVRVPLYHCADRSCTSVHGSFLRTADSQIAKTQMKLEEIFEKEHGIPSAFYDFFTEVEEYLCDHYGDSRCVGEIPLLGECFSESELGVVVQEALKGKRSPLREVLEANGITVRDPIEYSDSLGKAAKMQALLLMKSRDVVTCIDRAIYTGKIEIPEYEIRKPKVIPLASGFYRLKAECSRYGFRAMPSEPSLALVRLQRLILSIYPSDDPRAMRDLDWHLKKKVPGSSVDERLTRYLEREDPAEIIRHLILIGPGPFAIAAEKCGLALVDVEEMEDDDLLNILLWKLGFNVLSGDEASGSLQRHRDAFVRAIASYSGYGEAEKYEIKRESAPLFSSLEKALDSTLSFTAWALTFDHWSARPRFNYHLSDARAHMAYLLNKAVKTSSESIVYDPQGRNTLFPLISGFSRLADYLTQVVAQRESYRRPENEMPRYSTYAELTPFPFLHKIPFLDLSPDSQAKIIDLLKEFTKILQEGGVTDVRNRLQHQREDFPEEDELLCCVRAIGNFLERAESSGMFPTFFKSTGTSRDSAGRSAFSFKDYKGREYVAKRPSGIGRTGTPGLLTGQFILPVANLNAATDVLRFSVGTRSTYTELWQEWPKYRAATESARALMGPLRDSESG